MKKEIIILTAILLLQFLTVSYVFVMSRAVIDNQKLPAWNEYNNHSVKGVFFRTPSVCLPIGGRNLEEINESYTHESCHGLVLDDYKHFCGGTK